jgi:type VI secretion system secreted protein Hcp
MADAFAFLNLEGAVGESQDDKYKDHIELQSVSWGATNSSSFVHGTGPGPGTRGHIHDMSFTKFMCKASTELMKRCVKGEPFKTGELILVKQSGDKLGYYTVKMEEVAVTSYNMTNSGGGHLPHESFTIHFVVVKPNYVQQDNQGKPKGNFGFEWNLQKQAEH